jgi:hypothetical protein
MDDPARAPAPRCTNAVYNGTLGTGFGQRFYAASDVLPRVAATA